MDENVGSTKSPGAILDRADSATRTE